MAKEPRSASISGGLPRHGGHSRSAADPLTPTPPRTVPRSSSKPAGWASTGHRIEAALRALPIGAVAGLDQGEEPGQPGDEPSARGGVVVLLWKGIDPVMKRRLGGWVRLAIVLSLFWCAAVASELYIEQRAGPFGRGWLTDTVEAKTEAPRDGNGYRLLPVDQVVNSERFTLILFGPVFAMWILGGAWAWVRTGFRGSKPSS
jgi:hypothetical protein